MPELRAPEVARLTDLVDRYAVSTYPRKPQNHDRYFTKCAISKRIFNQWTRFLCQMEALSVFFQKVWVPSDSDIQCKSYGLSKIEKILRKSADFWKNST